MKIKVEIKPSETIDGKSKNEVFNKVHSLGTLTFSMHGTYLTGYNDRTDKFAIVANYQLVNKKTEQVKNKKTGITIRSVILHKKLWTVRIYKIPIDLLRVANLKVIQKARYFELVARDK